MVVFIALENAGSKMQTFHLRIFSVCKLILFGKKNYIDDVCTHDAAPTDKVH